MSKSFTIHDLPKSERPRERLQRFGPEALSAQEILSLILGRGIPGESVVVTAQKLLSTFGSIKAISDASFEELVRVDGIGLAKACQIKASFELAKRKDDCVAERIAIKSAEDVVTLIKPKLADKKKEYFVILSLDSRNNLIKVSDISIGTINASIVHPREVFKEAIQALACSVILVHNHPSGESEPSEDDLEITRRLVDAGKILGIEVIEHIIVSDNGYLSFSKQGLM
ncbi:MAG: DNA repair protein RadC [Candidatus Omnitrophota bacterium]|nr:DNA repair protein RadC [Candidatus Omnitrophota bacterium]